MDEKELETMAGKDRYVMVNSFEDLAKSMKLIMNCVCSW